MIARIRILLVGVLLISGALLYTFVSPTVSYAAGVLVHLAAGLILIPLIVMLLWRSRRQWSMQLTAWALLAAGASIGVVVIFIGGLRQNQAWVYAHIFVSLIGVAVLASTVTRRFLPVVRVAVVILLLAVVSAGAWAQRESKWRRQNRIDNPSIPPDTMDKEGDGQRGPFFPSSAQTLHGGKIDSKFFMESQTCQKCHADIYEQWTGSAHRFSSFNNQWYRKSIEYMQDVIGTRPSKWCAGCHDPALIFSGMMDTPIKDIVDRPESHAGLGCMACHSISHVKSSMGQADFTMEYPALHDLATSDNRVVRALHDFLTYVNPEPHRRSFMKPFMKEQTPEFCSSCHKVHLDVPVNSYRWIRGFNDYDNWQASAVSGQGARSFYYPPKPSKCADCHMPLVPSKNPGNVKGMVHSHRFPGANTALPTANQDSKQLETQIQFLKDKILSVDIFAVSPSRPEEVASNVGRQELSTSFAIGEEAEATTPGVQREVLPVTAPLNRVEPAVRAGDTVRVDVVVRTRKIGHFFPGGTVDAFDVWVEFVATADDGTVVFSSGAVENDGHGPVEKSAHFYKSLQVDGHGNPINKRNAWATRSVVYVRLIPPGAADTVHYKVQVPPELKGHIRFQAKVNYRKFAWWNTQFAYAGVRDPGGAHPRPDPNFDDADWSFTGDTSKVSGKIKSIPDVPIVVLAQDDVTVNVGPKNSIEPPPKVTLIGEDWTRWNDYGIGLFLQGDLKAAEAAFLKVTEIDSKNPDGWVNIGRCRVQEGNVAGARDVLERALKLAPDLARANFFFARVLRAEGKYDDAFAHLTRVAAQYPRDRVVRNDMGRILFLQKKYAEAIKEFEAVLKIDPEDLQAHYNLMLSYKGLGQEDRAKQHQALYLRFKADESAQAITGPYRVAHPEDNNERQPIHEHGSALPGRSVKK